MRKRTLLFSVALPLVALIPGVVYVVWPDARDGDIESIVREAGFNPLPAPSRLRGPGALYQVEGSRYIKVCDVDPKLLDGKVDKSPTEERTRQRLEQGNFSLKGGYLNALNASLGGNRRVTVELKLTQVAISEISMSKLLAIQDALLSEDNCQRTVQGLLRRNKQVCAGYSAISATTSYKLSGQSKHSFDAKAEVVTAVKQAIETQAGSKISVDSTDQLTGQDLFYGILLSELCITPEGASEPSVLPAKPAPEPPGVLNRLLERWKTI